MPSSSRDRKGRRYYTVVGRGEEGPLCDPGSELLLGGSMDESSASKINGMKKKCFGQTALPSRVTPIAYSI